VSRSLEKRQRGRESNRLHCS